MLIAHTTRICRHVKVSLPPHTWYIYLYNHITQHVRTGTPYSSYVKCQTLQLVSGVRSTSSSSFEVALSFSGLSSEEILIINLTHWINYEFEKAYLMIVVVAKFISNWAYPAHSRRVLPSKPVRHRVLKKWQNRQAWAPSVAIKIFSLSNNPEIKIFTLERLKSQESHDHDIAYKCTT